MEEPTPTPEPMPTPEKSFTQADIDNAVAEARAQWEKQRNLPGANNPRFYVNTLHKIRGCLTKYVSTQCNNTSKLLTDYSFSSSLHEP